MLLTSCLQQMYASSNSQTGDISVYIWNYVDYRTENCFTSLIKNDQINTKCEYVVMKYCMHYVWYCWK